VLEKRYVPRRSQRTRSVLTFFAEDAGTHTLLYANADVSKASQNREVIAPGPPLGIGEGCRLPPCRDQVEPDRAFPRVPGVFGVRVGAGGAAVDLAGSDLQQRLRRGPAGSNRSRPGPPS
jgi:hypothetical protein